MRKVIATGIAWVAVIFLALASVLTTLAEWVHRPRAAGTAPPGPPPGTV